MTKKLNLLLYYTEKETLNIIFQLKFISYY